MDTRLHPAPDRVAFIGDVGGHLDVFIEALEQSGVDVEAGQVPAGLTVIQVGDLVHKGPDDDGCVELADRLLRANRGRYVQVLGNHDAHYLGGPDVSARRGVSPIGQTAQQTLRRWVDCGLAQLAAAVDVNPYGPVLVTHAGLTAGLWEELGCPTSPGEAAKRVNGLLADPEVAFRPGWLMTGRVDRAAGVTCVRTGTELAAPWLENGSMPFSQIHGHEGVWLWSTDSWHDDVPEQVRAASTVDRERRFCWTDVAEHRLLSVDWVLGIQAPTRPWAPLVLPGTLTPQPAGDTLRSGTDPASRTTSA